MAIPSLGDLEFSVLVVTAHLGDAAYGASVRRELSQRAGRDYSVGAIYTTLDRLEEKGLVRSRYGEATPERGGRAKRLFRVTAAGATALKAAREHQKRLWAGSRRWEPA